MMKTKNEKNSNMKHIVVVLRVTIVKPKLMTTVIILIIDIIITITIITMT